MNSRTDLRRIDLRRIDLRGHGPASLSRTALAVVLPRAATDVEAAVAQIRPLCEDVKNRGAEAVREYTSRFDGVDLPTTVVPAEALDAALAGLDPEVRKALEEAVRRTRRVHAAQLPPERPVQVTEGLTVTGRFVPAGRAGVYVPGGLVAYPSSVVMNIVPAQVAGVASIAVASPPQRGLTTRRRHVTSEPIVNIISKAFVYSQAIGRWTFYLLIQ